MAYNACKVKLHLYPEIQNTIWTQIYKHCGRKTCEMHPCLKQIFFWWFYKSLFNNKLYKFGSSTHYGHSLMSSPLLTCIQEKQVKQLYLTTKYEKN